MGRQYKDRKGRILSIYHGIGSEDVFLTAWRERNGRTRRFKSPAVPPRPTQAEAQADLDALAEKRGWTLVPPRQFKAHANDSRVR